MSTLDPSLNDLYPELPPAIAERLGDLSISGILGGLVEDASAEDVLDAGAMDGHWESVGRDESGRRLFRLPGAQ